MRNHGIIREKIEQKAHLLGIRIAIIRELLKSLPATEESRVKAKVPDAGRRTSCTLSTLRALVKELSAA